MKYQQHNNQTLLKSSSQTIDSCTKLPLETYIEISLDHDHTRLGLAGTEQAWEKIQTEYDSIAGGVGHSAMFALLRDINYLHAKIEVITKTVEIMVNYYTSALGEILHNYGLRYIWEDISEEQYVAQLSRVNSQTKTWVVQLLSKRKDWEGMLDRTKNNTLNREYFEDWLIALSKEQGYHLNAKQITTYQFAVMLKKYTAEKQVKR